MNDSTLNESDLDYSSESNQADKSRCVVDEQFVPKVGMTFKTLEEARKFYKNYSKLADFCTKIRNTTRKRDEIKNQLIVCSREERWKSKTSPTLKTNPSAGINCPARIYVHILKNVDLYEDRHIWIPVYLDHHFWVRMRSTQRNESMHAFFNKFITHNSSLIQFVKQYDNCLASREHTVPPSLSVLSFEQVDNVAPKYILERWSKNIKREHIHIKSSQDEPQLEPRSKRFDDLVFRSYNIYGFALESEELTRILHWAFDNVMTEMQEYQAKSKGKSLLSYKDTTLSDVNEFQSPPHVRIRDRPKNRLGSNMEKKIANETKKKKKPTPSEVTLI
ncbi:hypothetical protein Ahy_B01g056253 [Arachis hypogaea]|uniref:Protein FAR1-RELATED SEQUENCE n=1 Tax=Arachis hypogaea TaxID=3818 RepID=A0A445AYG3_ARAHY|nr:hypothetical protein Ahy_B01g056253 [Arachis hypogaea]